jgi:hypothetical protein
MNNLLIFILLIAAFFIGGLLLSELMISVFGFDGALLIWLTIFVGSIWFGRQNKDGIVMLFKDIHQSNLDDIEEQELVSFDNEYNEKQNN